MLQAVWGVQSIVTVYGFIYSSILNQGHLIWSEITVKIRQKTLVIRNIKQIITIVVVSVLTILQWPSSHDLDLTTAQWPQAMTSTWLSFWCSWWTPTADSEHLARLPAHSFASNTLHSTQKKQSPSSCTAKECLFHSLTHWMTLL